MTVLTDQSVSEANGTLLASHSQAHITWNSCVSLFPYPKVGTGDELLWLVDGIKTSLRFSVKTSLILVETGWQEKAVADDCQNHSTWEIEQLSREWYSVEHQKTEVWLLSREIHNIVYILGNALCRCLGLWAFVSSSVCLKFRWKLTGIILSTWRSASFTFQNFKLVGQNNFRDIFFCK